MLMVILPDGVSSKTVEAASFLHLSITFSTGDITLDWRISVKMYMVCDNVCVSCVLSGNALFGFKQKWNQIYIRDT